MLDQRWAYRRRVEQILAAVADNGFFLDDDPALGRSAERSPVSVEGRQVRIALTLYFGHTGSGEPFIEPVPGKAAPYVLIEEWLSLLDGAIEAYNYDLVDPGADLHFGFHFHGHGDLPMYHRQGWGVPGGHETTGSSIEIGVALWELVGTAFETRYREPAPDDDRSSPA